jgi:hypothetical protein
MVGVVTVTLAVLVLTSLDACSSSPTPVGTPEPEIAVNEGGFSFQLPVGFGAKVDASQATIISDDNEIEIRLNGKSVCDIKSVEDMTDRFLVELPGVLMYLEGHGFEVGESYSTVIGARQGWAANVSGWLGSQQVSGRAAMIAPNNSQLLFALATAKAHRWTTAGEEAFNGILGSIAFFEPVNPSSFIPCFIHHTPPELSVDFSAFSGADLADLGCHAIRRPSDLFGGLEPSYPIAECDTRDSEDGYLYFVGEDRGSRGFYVIFRDGEFVPVRTAETFQEVFAPVETPEEALSYVLALTYSDRSPRAHYGFELDSSYSYFVDTIEDTYVERVEDGYIVHLFDYENRMCGGTGRQWVQTLAVDLRVTFQGNITQVSNTPVYQIPSLCLY